MAKTFCRKRIQTFLGFLTIFYSIMSKLFKIINFSSFSSFLVLFVRLSSINWFSPTMLVWGPETSGWVRKLQNFKEISAPGIVKISSSLHPFPPALRSCLHILLIFGSIQQGNKNDILLAVVILWGELEEEWKIF